MTVFINIVLILISLILIVVVLMQEGNKQGLGAIGGAAETFLGKSKSKGVEGKLLLITKVAAAVFVVLAIVTTMLSARTFTVKYYDDNGEEIFPAFENMIIMQEMFGAPLTEEQIAEATIEEKRATYSKGSDIIDYPVPTREGYVGTWDKELPDVMDGKNYELTAKYEIGQFTLTVQDGHNPVEEAASTEGEAHEHEVFFETTATYGEPVDLSAIQLPEAPEGYEVAWSQELPTTMPGLDTLITVVYTEIVEEATPAEATPVEPEEAATATPAEGE